MLVKPLQRTRGQRFNTTPIGTRQLNALVSAPGSVRPINRNLGNAVIGMSAAVEHHPGGIRLCRVAVGRKKFRGTVHWWLLSNSLTTLSYPEHSVAHGVALVVACVSVHQVARCNHKVIDSIGCTHCIGCHGCSRFCIKETLAGAAQSPPARGRFDYAACSTRRRIACWSQAELYVATSATRQQARSFWPAGHVHAPPLIRYTVPLPSLDGTR